MFVVKIKERDDIGDEQHPCCVGDSLSEDFECSVPVCEFRVFDDEVVYVSYLISEKYVEYR